MSKTAEQPVVSGQLPAAENPIRRFKRTADANPTTDILPPPGWRPEPAKPPMPVLHPDMVADFVASLEPVYHGLNTLRLTEKPIKISQKTYDSLEHFVRQQIVDRVMGEINRRGAEGDAYAGMEVII